MRAAFVLPLLLAAAPALAQDQQLGARTKAMGGSYTAFEDDPVSVWLNPAGIATQADQFALSYQTYTAYPVDQKRGAGDDVEFSVSPETIMVDPALLPSFLGFVAQIGDAEHPMAVGICYARPYHLNYALDRITDPSQVNFEPENNVEQSFARFRAAFAKDFRFTKVGKPGTFTHLAVGLGADVGYERWEFSGPNEESTDTSTALGFGAGILLGVYDNLESLKINFGLAYQSGVQYDFDIEPDLLPAFDMPQQVNAGVTFYLLGGTPLRVTLDAQWIDWSETAEDPLFANFDTFEDAVNYSIGLEYRVQISDKAFLYPRAGFRRFDAPWSDEDDLPATGAFKLILDTDADVFNIFTFGVGVSWISDGGKQRQIDLAGDVGGDSSNVAIGYTQEF